MLLAATVGTGRDTYDKYGEEGLKRTEGGGSADPFGDMFSHFGFGTGRARRDEEHRTPNVEVPYPAG